MNRWPRTQRPRPAAAPQPSPEPARPPRLVIPDEEMRHLLQDGSATPLSRIVTSFVRHDGHWWLDATGEWLAITDPDYTARLDHWATRS